MKVLVTGGAGFIGRWVVRQLLAKRHDVWVLDNFSSGSIKNLAEFKKDSRLKDVIRGDIRNPSTIAKTLHSIRPQYCYHLAAQVNVQTSLDDPKDTFEANVLGTYHLLEALRKDRAGLLLAGTCLVYRTTDQKISEKSAVEPRSPYAGSKLAAEEMAMGYGHGYGMPVVIVRPFNTYGPFQRADSEGGVVAIFLNRKIRNQTLMIYGSGRQTRDFLYVEDCADFILKAAAYSKSNCEIFNAGTGIKTPITRLARLVSGENVKHIPHHHPQAEIQGMACDYVKAKKILGWAPKVDLREGVRRTEQWLRSL